jgi:hypothetical protein
MGEIKMRQHNPLKAGLSWEKDQYLGKNQKEIKFGFPGLHVFRLQNFIKIDSEITK